jgi:hypothetical protein
MLSKSEVNIFGEDSLSHVESYGETFIIVRNCDHKILAMSKRFELNKNDTIRTMYTGEKHGTGDIILQADTPKGTETIYMFHD